MKIIAFILLLTSSVTFAQNISRTELRASNTVVNARISTNAVAVNARNAAAEVTNATQAAAISAANVTNAAQTVSISAAEVTNATQTAAIAAANVTNATQTADITAANATNATQTTALNALILHSVSTSNLLAMGITNIVAGANVVITTNSGVLTINSTASGSGATNNLPVFGPVTNLLVQNLDVDVFNVGTLIVTNNRAQFADAANHQIDGNIAPEWDGTNSMAQGTRLAITNGALMTNHQSFTIDLEGAAAGGSNYALTNTFPTGDLASLNGSVLASSFTDTVTNGTAFEDSWRRTWKRGTNIWVGYRAWRTR